MNPNPLLAFADYVNVHWTALLTSSLATAILAHAVNTFPTPKSEFGRWLLGVIQFAVGQRAQGRQTMNGGPYTTGEDRTLDDPRGDEPKK